MINTKYNGHINETDIISYYDRLIGKVFKLLPIYENSKKDFKNEYEKLMHELLSGEEILLNGGFYIELINKLEGLPDLEHRPFTNSKFSKRVKECIDVIEKIREEMELDLYG